MKVIVVGAGKVGYTIAKSLVSNNNDVTVIDKNAEVLREVENTLDVLCIKGNGGSASVLLEAGADKADLLIAVTGRDEVNMICCLMAKRLGTASIGARIRDAEYAKELSMLKEELELDLVINPESSTAEEIVHLLSSAGALRMESFAKGRVRMAELKVTPDMPIIGKKLLDLFNNRKHHALVGAVDRNGEVIIPNGEFVIKENDVIYLIGKSSSIFSFSKSSGQYDEKYKNVMVLGGGRIAYYLSSHLIEMGIKVKIIEKDHEKCLELSELLPDAVVINADGTDEEVLLSQNIDEMDAFIAITGMDEENLMSSLLAKQHGVKKIIPKISRDNYTVLVKKLGIDNIVSPKLITANQILKFIKSNKIESLYTIVEGQAEIIEFTVDGPSKLLNVPIKDLNLPKNTILATIVRKNEVVIPYGKDVIQKGDKVIMITKEHNLEFLNDLLNKPTGGLQSELRNGIKKLGDIINM